MRDARDPMEAAARALNAQGYHLKRKTLRAVVLAWLEALEPEEIAVVILDAQSDYKPYPVVASAVLDALKAKARGR